MSDLKEYEVELGGVKTTVQLTDEDAKRRGVQAKAAPAPANKARTASNK